MRRLIPLAVAGLVVLAGCHPVVPVPVYPTPTPTAAPTSTVDPTTTPATSVAPTSTVAPTTDPVVVVTTDPPTTTAAAPTTDPVVITTLPPLPTLLPTTEPAPTTTVAPPPPSVSDRTQAAVTASWGAQLGGDEFTYAGAPSAALWGVYSGTGNAGNGRRVASADTVAGGVLTITADAHGNTGGMALLPPRGAGRYGRVEVRMRAAATAAGGTPYHPVLIYWPDSNAWPSGGEYDFAEANVGEDAVNAFMHHPTSSGVVQDHYSRALDLTDWHNYAFEWEPTGLTGWIDGAVFFHDTAAGVQAPGPMHLTVQLDNTGGSNQPAVMQVDWVRTYRP